MSEVYRYTLWNEHQHYVSVYRRNTAKGVWYYDAHAEVPPEILALLKVKRRLSDTHYAHVFMQDGHIIDEPA